LSPSGPPNPLPQRDWLLLPLIAFASAVLVLAGGEGLCRLIWPEHDVRACYIDSTHTRPNCTETFKHSFEAPSVTETFNECGYRGTGPCRAPAPGGRIAVVGSSTSWGYMMKLDDVWSVLAARRVGAVCGVAPDIQSVGGFGDLNDAARSLPDVLKLNPQLVVLAITPFDLLKMPEGGFDPVHAPPSSENGPQPAGLQEKGLIKLAKLLAANLRVVGVAQHYQYLNPTTYVSTYLHNGDKADFLRPPFSPNWRGRIAYLDAAVGYITGRLDQSHIPFLILFVPLQAQADIVGAGLHYPGVDATALDRAIGGIATRHGALYIDGGQLFQGRKDASAYFYPVNTHINERGERLMGAAFAKTLLDRHLPGLCQAAPR
jgi:hypothetical protein